MKNPLKGGASIRGGRLIEALRYSVFIVDFEQVNVSWVSITVYVDKVMTVTITCKSGSFPAKC